MLFEKVAIEPDLLSSDELVYLLHHNFGWFDGRFVADLPKNWIDLSRKIMHTLPDGIKKKKLESLLQIQRLPTCRLNTNLNNYASWLDLIDSAKNNNEIPIVLCRNPRQEKGWFGEADLDKYLEDSKKRVGSLDIRGMKADQVITALDIFLEANKQIALINPDQWLLAQTFDNRELFKKMFSRWHTYGGVRFLVIRSKRSNREAEVLDRWDREINDLQKYLSNIGYVKDFKIIAVNDDADRLHDRYLLGNRFGLKLGYGLEISHTKSHPWTMMQQSEYVAQQRQFLQLDIRDKYPDHTCWVFRK